MQFHREALRKWNVIHGCSGCSGNCSRIRHPCLPALFSNYTTLPEPPFLLLCFMPSCSSSATSSYLLAAPLHFRHGLCLLLDASASIKTSLKRIRNGLGLTLFSAKCLCGFLRLKHLVVVYLDPCPWFHLLVTKRRGSHNTRYETRG